MYGKKNVMQQTRSEAAREGLVINYDFTISQLPLHSVQGQVKFLSFCGLAWSLDNLGIRHYKLIWLQTKQMKRNRNILKQGTRDIQTHANFFHKKRQAGATLPLNVCKQRGEGGSLAMGIHSMYLCAS